MSIYQCRSFFDKHYQPPQFIIDQQVKTPQNQTSQDRRHFLKSAAGVGAGAGLLSSFQTLAATESGQTTTKEALNQAIKTDPWLTLDATLKQLLPSSPTGPSAEDIKATAYLYQVMTVQPTAPDEKDFILKGVGWLNGYAQSEKSQHFAGLGFDDKEQLLRAISNSRAGQNWLNTLLGYLLEAMLTPPSYGGNPNGIGWQWLEHQAGFPLPQTGQRYFELPKRARINLISHVDYQNISKKVSKKNPINKTYQGTQKA